MAGRALIMPALNWPLGRIHDEPAADFCGKSASDSAVPAHLPGQARNMIWPPTITPFRPAVTPLGRADIAGTISSISHLARMQAT
jgi:hypothetical protein